MSFWLPVAAWVTFWSFVFWVVLPWYVKRKVRQDLMDWEANLRRNRVHLESKRPKSLVYDPTDPGMNRGYVPGDDPEES